MRPFKLNLSKFKKIDQDRTHTTLRHDDGHEIKIAHNSLSPKMRGEIARLNMHDPEPTKATPAKMADGGKVSKADQKQSIVDAISGKAPKAPEPQSTMPSPTAVQSIPLSAKPMDPIDQAALAQGAANVSAASQDQALAAKLEAINAARAKFLYGKQGMAEGGEVGKDEIPINLDNLVVPEALANPNPGAMAQERAVSIGQAPINPEDLPYGVSPEAMQQPVALPTEAPKADLARQPSQSAAPSAQKPASDPFGNEAMYQEYSKGVGEQKAGIFGLAQAEAQAGAEQAKLLNKQAEKQMTMQKAYQDHFNVLDQERKNILEDIQGSHIDPNHFMSSMGTGQKIASAIGLILGGIGAGGTNGENLVAKQLNTMIDRDINAQRLELGKKENLLSANMKQFGNVRDATDMARVMQMDIVANQLKAAAAKATDPMAKARALQAAGQLDMQAAPIVSQIAMRRSLLSGMENGQVAPEKIVNFLVPEGQRAAANKELSEAQEAVAARDNLNSAFDKLSQLSTVGSRVSSPIQSSKQIAAVKEPLVAALSKATAGRFTEQDSKMLDSLFPATGDSAQTLAEKRMRMNHLVSEKMHYPVLKSYGIDVNKMGRFSGQGQSRIQESKFLPSK